MSKIEVNIISRSEDLPEFVGEGSFFHSPELFRIIEQTPGQQPYMAIAMNDGRIEGRLLITLRRRGSWLPPYLFTQARAYGEGDYADCADREAVFSYMLEALCHMLRGKLCLYIEFSDLSTKMFGYGRFRASGFFPVHWMKIHNSLHSMPPVERLLSRAVHHLDNARRAGLDVSPACTDDDIRAVVRMMHGYTTLHIRRYIPHFSMFSRLQASGRGDVYITREGNRIIGGCVCVYSGCDSYLWYLTACDKLHMKRTYAITVWTAISKAYDAGYRHINFMDVGLPFRRHPLREFILTFGGKPVGTYRWFRCTISWINKILTWLYRE